MNVISLPGADVTLAIANELQERKALTFIDLELIFQKYNYDYHDDVQAIYHKDNRKIIMWEGWNDEAIDLLNKITGFNNPAIRLAVCNPVKYGLLGRALNYPLTYDPLLDAKTEHWLPVELTIVE